MDEFKVDAKAVESSGENSLCHLSLDEWTRIDKASLAKKYAPFAIDEDRPVEEIIRPPNADDSNIASVLDKANRGRGVSACREVPWGKLVSVGEILIVKDNGQVNVVGPGRWAIKFNHYCFASFGPKKSVTDNTITYEAFTMVRVQRGELGLAVENGKPVLLQEGLHVYNNPLFKFVEFRPVNSEHVKHMSYHVVRVPKGCFGKIMEQARAKLLPEGTHAVDNAVFEYGGLVSTIDQYIQHQTIHIIQVPKGSVGLVSESNFPRLLHEGVHIYDSPSLKFEGVKSLQSSQILHGTISRFRVQMGEIGLAWYDNQPMLIEEPGTYQVDSASFRFVSLMNASDKLIVLGSKKIITVYDGEVAVTYKGGVLQVLQKGRHLIEAADHSFSDFLSTQQKSIRLETEEKDAATGDLLVCETKDLVKIGVRADVFYRIFNPEVVITQVGVDFISELVRETSIATLNNIIRSTALGEIAQSSAPSAQSTADHAEKLRTSQALAAPSAPLFFDKAHDQFLSKLHDDFKARYGLEITNIRIEQFKILDESLQASISGQAKATAETQSQLANLEGQMQIATQQKERDARMGQIQAEADARTLQTKANSEKAQAEALAAAQQVKNEMEANTKRTQATAEADAIRTKAQAQADAVKIEAEAIVNRARAEAEAIKLKAQAEGERAKLLGNSELGQKLSLLEVYSDMVKKSNEGVEKIIYADPTITQSGNPFSLLTLQTLQSDMKQLSASVQ